MDYNVFTKPTQTFGSAIEDSSLLRALVIVLISGLLAAFFFSLTGMGNLALGLIVVWVIVQWFVLSVLLFAFEILFSGQKRQFVRADFKAAATVAGQLWLWVLLLEVVLLVFGSTLFSMAPMIGIAVLIVIGVAMLIDLFIGIRVVLDSSNGRAFLVWLLLLIVYGLILSLAGIIASSMILL
jgi:hypothetical protein